MTLPCTRIYACMHTRFSCLVHVVTRIHVLCMYKFMKLTYTWCRWQMTTYRVCVATASVYSKISCSRHFPAVKKVIHTGVCVCICLCVCVCACVCMYGYVVGCLPMNAKCMMFVSIYNAVCIIIALLEEEIHTCDPWRGRYM
jgi:hypothetical protein